MFKPLHVSLLGRLGCRTAGIAMIAGAAATQSLYADIEVGPTIDVRRGTDPLLAGPLSASLPANFLDVRPDNVYAGLTSAGELRIFSGVLGTGVLQNANGFVGHNAPSNGIVTVETAGIWSSEDLTVGKAGTGTLDVLTGGVVGFSGVGMIGDEFGSMGTANVSGAGSRINSNTSSRLTVGNNGTGFLHISDEGLVSNANGELHIGETATGVGTVTVDGAGTLLELQLLRVGELGEAVLDVTDGGVVTNDTFGFIATGAGSDGDATVDGAGSRWEAQIFLVGQNGGDASLAIIGGGLVEAKFLGDMQVGRDPGTVALVTVDGAGSTLDAGGEVQVGMLGGQATLEVTNGGLADLGRLEIAGDGNGTVGTVTVDGVGSEINIAGTLLVAFSGDNTSATLDIRNGGFVSTDNFFLTLDESFNRVGQVIIQSGGELRINGLSTFLRDVTLADGTITFGSDQTYDPGDGNPGGNVNGVLVPRGGVLGPGERLKVDGQFSVFSPIVIDGGALSARSIPTIGLVDLVRGELELSMVDVDVTDSGLLGDEIALGADQHLKIGQTLSVLGDGRVDLSGGRLGAGQLNNAGTIMGDGRVDGPLDNQAGGEVRVSPAETLLFTGAGNVNDGQINLLGGISVLGATVEFDQDLTNSPTGTISGRGTLIADGGLTNEGEMLFSGGFIDVFGDVAVTAGALVRVDGGSVATFHGDVDNEGVIQTTGGSQTVFLGAVGGSGDFASGGTVVFEDVFSPGSSPGEVLIDGDAVLGAGARLVLELGGAEQGVSFDHVSVSGALRAGGALEVVLIDGFTPALGTRFDVLSFGAAGGGFDSVVLPALGHGLSFDASGLLTDGSLVVVPEPGAWAVVLSCMAMGLGRRLRTRRLD